MSTALVRMMQRFISIDEVLYLLTIIDYTVDSIADRSFDTIRFYFISAINVGNVDGCTSQAISSK